ncbi:unnamed protein product [Rotaria sp. Silwood1]|nr:unnamed protein product [Rotaria sp. Silwood1]
MLIIGIAIVLGTLIVALSIVTLVKVNKKFHTTLDNSEKLTISSKAVHPSSDSVLDASIRIDEVMSYLNEFQRIATANNGTRAVNTPGFNATLNYIENYLTANTNYKITKTFFFLRDFVLASNPILISSINGAKKNYTYSTNLAIAEFYHVKYSTSANFSSSIQLTVIPNVGCSDDDWQKATLPPQDRVALVKRGICGFQDKAILAAKYNVAALLIYNDGESPDRVSPLEVNLAQDNAIPALFLSFTVGQVLVNAAKNSSTNITVQLIIDVKNLPDFPVGNICADTPTGDVTQTIVIGSHSDSVTAGPGINDNGNICADTPTGDVTQTIVIGSHSDSVTAGPGINDNGSGSAANLALAVSLARLFRTSTYPKYKYRVRFCWWGAEELGLLGADFHVKQAKNSSIIGERLSDYLINLNYDTIGSPNYMLGIYDGATARNDTPSQALVGSIKITALFRDWFIQQNLPYDYRDVSGRSDYAPFLAEGVVSGGLSAGTDGIKTQNQRDRYDQMLGQGLGGISGIMYDPCYHKACDTIQNINILGYEKMVKAAAYVLEFLGREEDLKTWLYPFTK